MLEELVGQSLNRYRLVRRIGENGLGTLFKAYDPTLERELALKVINPTIGNRPYFAENFTQAARLTARLDHPSLVEIYDFGEARSYYFVVMEYIPGDDLDQMLVEMRQAGQWIPMGEAVQIVRHLALAMEYVRKEGATQRTLKPGNVKIRPMPSERLPYLPVLTDLGLAHLIEGKPEENPLLAPAYLSPEEANGRPSDARSDVYSLGVLLFELVTGQLPFPVQTLQEAVRYHTRQPVTPPSSFRPNFPEGLEQVILKALDKNPENRFSGPAALAGGLEAVFEAASQITSPPPAFEHSVSLLAPYRQSLAKALTEEDSPTTQVAAATAAAATGHEAETVLAGATTGPPPVEMLLENAQLTVDPGGSVLTTVTVVNQSTTEKTLRLSLDGVPSAWVSVTPQVIRLQGNESREAKVTIQPPRSPQSRAGRYPITMRAVPMQGPGRAAEAKGTLTVSAFSHFTAELYTPRLRTSDTGQIHVSNQGNTQETFTFNFRDADNELTYIPPENLRLEKGQTGIAEFRTQMRQPRWIGSPKLHGIQAQIISSGGESQTLHGEVLSQPVLPTWLVGIFLVGTLCILGSIALLFGSTGLRVSRSTATAIAAQTLSAQAIQGTAGAGTATALFLSNANQATIDAVTATAAWLPADDDADGLSNQDELARGTLPDERDTDRDGINDGDEVTRRTDPLRPDTDNDGLSDGDEVRNNLDPLNPDTDGDGLPDAQDPNPLQTSTAAPNLQATDQAATAQAAATAQSILARTAAVQTAVYQTAVAQAGAQTQTAAAQQAVQGALTLTAAAQQAFQQTAAAQTVAAQTAAAQQGAALTATAIMAGNIAATQTAQAQVTPAPEVLPVVYLYLTNPLEARDYQTLLQANGFQVETLPLDAITSNDFNSYRAIILGPDTGTGDEWGQPNGNEVATLVSTGKPILGIGEGGQIFMQQANPGGSWSAAEELEETSVIPVNPADPVWATPFPIPAAANQPLGLYNTNSPVTAIVLQSPPPEFVLIGRLPSGENIRYALLGQGDQFLLWGFGSGPASMTETGQQLFINMLRNMAQ